MVKDIAASIALVAALPPAQLCMLARRAPNAVRTGNEEGDKLEADRRTALVQTVQILHNNPELIEPTCLALSTGRIRVPIHGLALDRWPEQYTCVDKWPKYAIAQLLQQASNDSLT